VLLCTLCFFFLCEKRRILRLVLRPHRIARIWWPGSGEVGGSRVINSETNYRSMGIWAEPVGSLLLSSLADCRSHHGFSDLSCRLFRLRRKPILIYANCSKLATSIGRQHARNAVKCDAEIIGIYLLLLIGSQNSLDLRIVGSHSNRSSL